jgi:hypothetical protein
MLRVIFIRVVCLLGVIIVACDDADPDPCRDKHPTTADFRVYESNQLAYPNNYTPTDTDTVATDYVVFEAVEDDAVYEWTLGTETITTKSFKRHGFPRGQSIEVSLKVKKLADAKCFPDDDGQDFKTREFYTTSNYHCDSNLNGIFEGFDTSAPSTKREVTIETCAKYPFPTEQTELRITNLVTDCDAFGFGYNLIGYHQLYFLGNGQSECLNPEGLAVASKNNDSIRIDYIVNKSPEDFINRVKRTFVGKRK